MKNKPIIYLGIYKGIGDFIGALVAVGSAKSECSFVIFTYGDVEKIVPLNIPSNVRIISLGNVKKIGVSQIICFLWCLLLYRPNYYFISDFSVNSFSFSKLLQLIVCRLFFIHVVGSTDDNFSFLYKTRLPSSKNIELIRKDYFFLSQIIELFPIDKTINYLATSILEPPKKYRYIIHIGASTFNKRLSSTQVNKLVARFSRSDCVVIGTEPDFLSSHLFQSEHTVDFLVTSFDEMLSLIKYCDVFVGYDSAAANIANLFGKRLHVISGPANSDFLYQRSTRITIHRSSAECQACGKPFCTKKNVLCMDGFDPDHLFERIIN